MSSRWLSRKAGLTHSECSVNVVIIGITKHNGMNKCGTPGPVLGT